MSRSQIEKWNEEARIEGSDNFSSRYSKLIEFVEHGVNNCKILVVGDLMLDKYYYGEVTRISPEAPVPITHVKRVKETLGGAANVAHNLALLGCKTSIAGYIGDDGHGESMIEKLIGLGIDYFDVKQIDKPTTTKIRVIGGHQQMMRLDFEDSTPIEGLSAEEMLENINEQLNSERRVGAVIISDYGKGTCTERVCQKIIKECKKSGINVIVDPKGRDWEKYRGADYITPNLSELNAVVESTVRNEDREVEQAAKRALSKYKIKNMIVTRSERGMSLITESEVKHIKAKAREVYDVSGAGDTVIAVFTLALTGDLKAIEAAQLANLAAGVVVGKVGTYAVDKEELLEVLM